MPATNKTPRASATATLIAGALVLAGHEPALRSLLAPGTVELSARLLVASGRGGAVNALGFGLVRAVLRALERRVLPGIIVHYLARKRALEAAVLETCSAGEDDAGACQQVVVLGAGLDTLAWRRHRSHPHVRWIEVDRPGALQVKATALPGAGENLARVPADLAADDLGETLRQSGAFDPGRRTLFLAEGLLMYLPRARVEALFATTCRLGRTPTRWLFTTFEPRDQGGIGFRRSSWWVDPWLRARGEPFRWAASEEELKRLLGQHGLTVQALWRAADLRERFLRPVGLEAVPLAEGEAVCVARAEEA